MIYSKDVRLQNCPLCDSALVSFIESHIAIQCIGISCTCGIGMALKAGEKSTDLDQLQAMQEDRETLIEKWNTRV